MCDGSSLSPDDFILTSGVKNSGGLELETYNLEDIEKTIIEKVLKTNQGNVTQAATQLGLHGPLLGNQLQDQRLGDHAPLAPCALLVVVLPRHSDRIA